MPEQKIARTWQEIAELAANEKDPEKLYQLVRELEMALDERDRLLNNSDGGAKTGAA
ncbi:MAG TPA: hypothetical protein VFA89_12160 [Terriglobales bacterium]|nr:hypothetical protein [Terriglobales bacterium]